VIKGNSIVKSAESFPEHNAKIHLKIPYRYREIVRKPKRFHPVMTSMTMFTSIQNPSNYVVSQTSKTNPHKSV